MELLLTLILACLVVWIVIGPLLARQSDEGENIVSSLAALQDQKDRAIQLLKDLELDHQTGKIAEHDYAQMKASLAFEIGTILQQIDQTNP